MNKFVAEAYPGFYGYKLSSCNVVRTEQLAQFIDLYPGGTQFES
jgi:hypothetical protein